MRCTAGRTSTTLGGTIVLRWMEQCTWQEGRETCRGGFEGSRVLEGRQSDRGNDEEERRASDRTGRGVGGRGQRAQKYIRTY